MLLFPLYAIGIWLLVARWRRTWRGFGALVAGVAGVTIVTLLYRQIARWFGNDLPVQSLMTMLIGTGALVLIIGTYIFVLPVRRAPGHCPWCHYDLRGHETEEPRCPECGKVVVLPPADAHASSR